MLKMFQRKPSRKDLQRKLEAITEENGWLRGLHKDEQNRANDLDRELIAAKADRRRLEAELAAAPKVIRRVSKPVTETPIESAVKRAEMADIPAQDTGSLIRLPLSEHPEYVAAKATYDKAVKDKKKNKPALQVLQDTRTRLMRAGFK